MWYSINYFSVFPDIGFEFYQWVSFDHLNDLSN